MSATDILIQKILTETKIIACVGMSIKPTRPSFYVSKYLNEQGYHVIPVNPVYQGEVLLDEAVRESITAIEPDIHVDMIDIFRRREDVLPVVEEALARFPNLRSIWMQLGISNSEAADVARARGVDVIQNRCPKIEYSRLMEH